jgi:hypothetical protein
MDKFKQGHKELPPQAEVFVEGIEVTEATPSDWLDATTGRHKTIPHARREKVVPLKAAPPESWRLL